MASNKSSTAEPFVKTKIRRTKRDAQPAHNILKIKSFSELLDIVTNTEYKKYESNEFEVGDFKWRMVVYPRGNAEANGEGHISMYIASTDEKAISNGCHVNALVSLFVYDHIRDKYLTIQDGKIKRYHVLRTEHGFDQLLSLEKFNDLSNGYVANNCCIFGAEVHVIKSTVQGSVFSIVKDPPNATLTWTVDRFLALKNECHYSDTFSGGGYKWHLMLYPKGDAVEKDKSLSLFLALDNDDVTEGQGVYAEYKILIKDQMYGNDHECTGNCWFRSLNATCGYSNFMPLRDLKNKSKGFLLCDSLVVEAKISSVSAVQDLS